MFNRVLGFTMGLLVLSSTLAVAQPNRDRDRRVPPGVERRYEGPGVRHPDEPRYGVRRPYWQPLPPRPEPRFYAPPIIVRPTPLYPYGVPSVSAYIEYLEWVRYQEAVRRLRQRELELLYR